MGTGINRERCIMSHRSSRLNTVICHMVKNIHDIFIGIAENLVQLIPGFLIMRRKTVIGNRQITEFLQMKTQPLSVRICFDVCILAFLVFDHPFFHGVRKKYFPRHQA